MTKKIFLTSAIAMCIACPSFAEDFPQDGYMQENTTYDNAATDGNMDGVYEGSVNANAEYDDILYTIGAGKYLAAGGTEVIDCNVSGSFCPGLENQVSYDANNAQGLTSCSDATSGAYTLSDGTGSTADSCYRTCSGNVTIEHATAVSGNDYYGVGTDTCAPTECENGWHLMSGIGYLKTIIGTGLGQNYAYIDHTGKFAQSKSSNGGGTDHDQAFYGITENNTWAVYYDSTRGMATGQARCSSVTGGWAWQVGSPNDIATHTTEELGEIGGDQCYCKLTGYIKNDETYNMSSPWVLYVSNFGSSSSCTKYCARDCATGMRSVGTATDDTKRLMFREALLDAAGPIPASCGANTITIDWSDVDSATAGRNNEGTVKYGGNIRTPYRAVEKRGHTFKGWKFIKTTE